MKYQHVYLDTIEYALPPHVLTSAHIEDQLKEVYAKLHIQPGQLAAWTGIYERRLWAPNTLVSDGAILAGKKALDASGFSPNSVDMLIYAGVCRDQQEPATACRIAHALKIGTSCQIFDISNACLGVLNAIVQGANAISADQAKIVLIVSAESSREIIDSTISRIQQNPTMDFFKQNIATLTGGSGAVAVLLTHEKISVQGHKLLGGIARQASQHYELCRWGHDQKNLQETGLIMETDAVGVLKYGVELGVQTFHDFQNYMNWGRNAPDKIITHQVGATHQATFLKAISFSSEKDFTTFPVLGNIGSVSLPITAAIANQRRILQKGQRVGFLGIGSGLNCLVLGFQW